MNEYIVTFRLIKGYKDDRMEIPIIKTVEFKVKANTKDEAIREAEKLDKSPLSIWEYYATEIIK